MHIEFLVEEPSAEAALTNLAPKILGPATTFKIHPHQGKSDLLVKLPGRLKGYRNWLPQDWLIAVLIDEDRADCRKLKARLEQAAQEAGLITRSTARHGRFQVLNRIAIEELEAWFLGDSDALRQTFPNIDLNLANKAGFRDPDAVAGGTWEALERVIRRAGAHRGGLAKISAAREISRHMDVDRNRSLSFRVFRDGLRAAAALHPHP